MLKYEVRGMCTQSSWQLGLINLSIRLEMLKTFICVPQVKNVVFGGNLSPTLYCILELTTCRRWS